jgi:hypothetical protein
VGAYTSGSVVVQVVTGRPAGGSARIAAPGAWRVWPVALGIALLPLALGRRRRPLLLLALLAVLAGALTSCVSASGGSQQHSAEPGETPPATYPIPVTVQAYGVAHKVTVTLTVD